MAVQLDARQVDSMVASLVVLMADYLVETLVGKRELKKAVMSVDRKDHY